MPAVDAFPANCRLRDGRLVGIGISGGKMVVLVWRPGISTLTVTPLPSSSLAQIAQPASSAAFAGP